MPFYTRLTLSLADKEHGTLTPALLQIVARLPFRYGKNRLETMDSWLDCRASAFMSTRNSLVRVFANTIPTGAACFACDEAVLKVGSPVSGFSEGSNSKEHFGAQLTGWDLALASEWSLLDRASFPAKLELNGDVISALPQLRRGNFPIAHAASLIR